MKLILSRKGFDSSAGGVPSPIFPDGRMLSFPIPDKNSAIAYGDISHEGGSLGDLVADLTDGRIPPHYRAHIDPDLKTDSLPRLPDWRPIFGQTGQAQGHLRNNNVEQGDLFLFFGLFRRVEMVNDAYTWAGDSRPCHAIWGGCKLERCCALGCLNRVVTSGQNTTRTSIAATTLTMCSTSPAATCR